MIDRRDYPLIAALAVGVLMMLGLSLAWGDSPISLPSALGDLMAGRHSVGAIIVGQLRLPRAILGVSIGAALGLCGAVMQGYLRNPLADPGLLGVSGGAALGTVLVFYTGLAGVSALLLPAGGLVGALLAVLLLLGLVGQGGTLVLLLAGAAMSSFAAALTAMAMNLMPSPYAAYEVMRWVMGSLTDRTMTDVWVSLPGTVAGCLLMLTVARALDALALGDEVAESMGFRLRGLLGIQTRVVVGAAVAVGSCVAVSGAIGFVGLVVPHLLRPLTGHQPSRLLLPSALGGALLLLVADAAVRLLSGATEIQIGVLTALIGAPVFFHRVIAMRRTMP